MYSYLCETNQNAYEEAGFISPREGIKVSQQLFKNLTDLNLNEIPL